MSTDRLGPRAGLLPPPPPVHPLSPSAPASPSHSVNGSWLHLPPPAPPVHPQSPFAPPTPSAGSSRRVDVSAPRPPALPPRPSQANVLPQPVAVQEDAHWDSSESDDDDDDGQSEVDVAGDHVARASDAPTSPTMATTTSSTNRARGEEGLSDVQLLQLYDDEEIDRFLHLFSSYVREVRVAEPGTPSRPLPTTSLSAPALPYSGRTSVPQGTSLDGPQQWNTSISERTASDLLLPLLPPHRPPPPEFSFSRLKHTSQRLYVAAEPIYSSVGIPLLKLATWKDPKKSFAYCALYWILWYHGLLVSGAMLRVLYELVRWKIHPYPSLAELREHRSRIDRSQHFGSMLSTRLAASPALGFRDVWDLFGDYRHVRKLKKIAKGEVEVKSARNDAGESENGIGSVKSASYSTSDLVDARPTQEAEEEADLKRIGLFLMNEFADLLERVKNIFLWRQPGASAYYGLVLLGYFVLGLLPARYVVKSVGLVLGGIFWHVTPIVAAIPASERDRIPSPLWIVPTDTEYAMELISQRVARGLPVRAKRRRAGRHPSESSVFSAPEGEGGSSSSVDWNKWGQRLASTKERAGDIKQLFQDGQWKRAENWKTLNPLVPRVVGADGVTEPRVRTQTFLAQLKGHPGMLNLTETTLHFLPPFSSRASLTVELADITGVKKTRVTKGIDVYYTESHEDGSRENREANFMFVSSRTELFARLVSAGGKRFVNV